MSQQHKQILENLITNLGKNFFLKFLFQTKEMSYIVLKEIGTHIH